MKTILILFLTTLTCVAQPYSLTNPPLLPDAKMTPGAVFTNATVQQITTKGYANVFNGGVRNVPEKEKKAVFIEYFGVVPPHPGDYEIDHLCALTIGGANDIKNLWPQAGFTQPWNFHVKDRLEVRMETMLRHCLQDKGHDAATALLKQMQTDISGNWTNAYVKYFGLPPAILVAPHQKK